MTYHDRIAAFEKAIIEHKQMEDGMRQIRRLHLRHAEGDDKLKTQALIVAGSSGAGKTTLLENYMKAHGSKPGETNATGDADVKRIIYVEIPHRPNKRQFLASILMGFGYRWTARTPRRK